MQGWLPKPGLQYGGHYVLYPRHPSQCHSTFVVRLVRVDDAKGLAATTQTPSAPHQPPPSAEPGGAATAQPSDVRPAVDDATGGAGAPGGGLDRNTLAWVDLVACMRVAGQVRKRLLLAYLHLPSNAPAHDPACLSSLQVRCMDAGAQVCVRMCAQNECFTRCDLTKRRLRTATAHRPRARHAPLASDRMCNTSCV